MKMKSFKRKISHLLIVLMSVTFLVACGDDDDKVVVDYRIKALYNVPISTEGAFPVYSFRYLEKKVVEIEYVNGEDNMVYGINYDEKDRPIKITKLDYTLGSTSERYIEWTDLGFIFRENNTTDLINANEIHLNDSGQIIKWIYYDDSSLPSVKNVNWYEGGQMQMTEMGTISYYSYTSYKNPFASIDISILCSFDIHALAYRDYQNQVQIHQVVDPYISYSVENSLNEEGYVNQSVIYNEGVYLKSYYFEYEKDLEDYLAID